MRTAWISVLLALVLALGALEVLASRATPMYPVNHPDAFAIWHAR